MTTLMRKAAVLETEHPTMCAPSPRAGAKTSVAFSTADGGGLLPWSVQAQTALLRTDLDLPHDHR